MTLSGVPIKACEDISEPWRGSVRMWAVEIDGVAHGAVGDPMSCDRPGAQANAERPIIKQRIDFITPAKVVKKAEPWPCSCF